MGNSASQTGRKEKARSDGIDEQIEEHNKKYKRECKILLLGLGESGKSTFVKQMKIAHHEEFTPEELTSYRPIIYKNVLESAHALIKAMRKPDVEPSTYATRLLADKVLDYRIDESTGTPLSIPI